MSEITQIVSMLWRRLDKPGSDAAQLVRTAGGYELSGRCAYFDETGPSALSYRVQLLDDWRTLEAQISGFVGSQQVDDYIVRRPDGWTLNGDDLGMADILDVDFGFTPATNLAQLRRVGLAVGERAAFDVAWIDAGGTALERLAQEYKRESDDALDYRSPMSDYHATLVLAPNGFVVDYPKLWVALMRPS